MKRIDIFGFFKRNKESDEEESLIKKFQAEKKIIRETNQWVPHNRTKPRPYPVKQLELCKGGQEGIFMYKQLW